MTKEQEDSIKILENTDISTIELAENTDLYTYSIAVKNVLNMLKEKDAEIEKLKEENKNIMKLNANMSKRHLNDIFKIKKKDKMIDLMAGFMLGGLKDFAFNAICKKGKCVYELKDNRPTKFRQCKNCIKEFFARKAE